MVGNISSGMRVLVLTTPQGVNQPSHAPGSWASAFTLPPDSDESGLWRRLASCQIGRILGPVNRLPDATFPVRFRKVFILNDLRFNVHLGLALARPLHYLLLQPRFALWSGGLCGVADCSILFTKIRLAYSQT